MKEADLFEAIELHNEMLADQMVEIFNENSVFITDEGVHRLTERGFWLLQGFFEDVHEGHRESVFIKFVDALEKNGVSFDREDFQEESVH